MKRFHLIKKKEVWVITIRGWLVIGLTLLILLGFFGLFVHPFFAVTDPKRGQILVVEGWLPRYAMERAVREFQQNRYQRIITMGGPIYSPLPCADYPDYAALGAAVLKDLQVDADRIIAVPAPEVKKDRTYVSALALKNWFHRNRLQPGPLDVITLGIHARRSRMLYQTALGADIAVGVISVPDHGYDPDRW